MAKALVVDVIIPEKDYDSVFKKVFGITERTIFAEKVMKKLDGYCFLCSEDDCIFGDYPSNKASYDMGCDTFVYLSQLYNDYDIGSM